MCHKLLWYQDTLWTWDNNSQVCTMPPLDQIHDPVSYTAVMAIVVAMAAMAVMGSIPEMVMAKSSTGIQDHIN